MNSSTRRVVVTAVAVTAVITAATTWILIGPELQRACSDEVITSAAAIESTGVDSTRREISEGSSRSVIDRINEGLADEHAGVLFCGDFADPFAQYDNDHLYVFATNSRGSNVPVLRTIDGAHGHVLGDALPVLPGWSTPGRVWAPAVLRVEDRWVLFYTTTHSASGLQCISVATSVAISGPYEDPSDEPLICPTDLGGAIDPSPFVSSDGKATLLWKNDGNANGTPTTIWASALTASGTELTDAADAALLGADQPWEGNLVEGPSMIEFDGELHLFYAANDWSTADYATGHAICDTPMGPCTKAAERPWLSAGGVISGPGGVEAFHDGDGDEWVVFHAWIGGQTGNDNSVRALFALPLTNDDGTVEAGAPTDEAPG